MSDNTKISWSDATWRALSGRELAKGIAPDVVARHVAPWTMARVVPLEFSAAAAGTLHDRVALVWPLALMVFRPMCRSVVKSAADHLKVFGSIVRLVAVAVVDDLTLLQWPSKHLFGHQAVLIDVAARVGPGMVRPLNEHVAARSHRAPTLPLRILSEVLGHA